MDERVESTQAAREMLGELWDGNGPLLIHQSGGCCDGSAPMVFTVDEFRVGDATVRLGTVELGDGRDVPVWVSDGEARVWANSVLVLDLAPGRAAGFSLEGSTGKRFVSRVRITGADGAACPVVPQT
ncbi:DUF779 domain-containing protein [Tsukamurella ocularis]|uniref:DUF779 domain-containing protein n=1 Tax=Tsukamurella ocularis TaxID=1970234 RepID=UPI00216A2ECA|nr:DUF779 domain-containing protein [Tsukamurella ocularis]MCS3779114.1 uncharacterized protein (DUF779 family) [Tsukamurella ocularis]MCS3787266.1 uncharacterized protein (DUF779 family) [Tsukamurella ocularis]MCS3851797.1 uncharacterized protein (DUF779 family) [Tsukamurella ocularis]